MFLTRYPALNFKDVFCSALGSHEEQIFPIETCESNLSGITSAYSSKDIRRGNSNEMLFAEFAGWTSLDATCHG